ncbi:hypothetical protein [Fulvivirga ligni]|uniref:hypothetical protein n=1 Tax=Fulvivirga ligni TaxID=2904246 RepID=UPI001F435AAF|nr:hypothetical protein [Fulvivirga ligni]UII20711.1 hypothetical protein LVD16_22990 [Fulvivirga ligni]
MNPNDSDLKPEWLKELQLKSWEPEILLSGIVLYGMFQVPEVLDRFLLFFSAEVYNDINAMDTLVALLKIGVYWLIAGLILHLICRGFWVGLVGLSYSFPDGINLEKLKFQPKYLKKVKEVPPFEQIILRVERVCSFIYSVSFLLFMSLVGTYLYATVVVVIPMAVIIASLDSAHLTAGSINLLNRYGNWAMILGFVGVADFITMGYFRRFKFIAKIYWPFYVLFNFLTLANYYRPTYFAIVTNLKKRWLFLFLLSFAFISFVGIASIRDTTPDQYFSRLNIWNSMDGNLALEGFYQDRPTKPSERIQIPSDIIKDDVLRVFIPSTINKEDSLKKFINYDSIKTTDTSSKKLGKYYLKKMSEYYRLTIADSTFTTKGYFQNNKATRQKGYVCYLNIGYLKEGLYELKLEGPKDMFKDPVATVPFYKAN